MPEYDAIELSTIGWNSTVGFIRLKTKLDLLRETEEARWLLDREEANVIAKNNERLWPIYPIRHCIKSKYYRNFIFSYCQRNYV